MTQPHITVIDFGLGNLLSVQRGLEHVGAKVTRTNDPEQIACAEKLVLPGVGAFSSAMERLQELGLIPAIQMAVSREIPFLGICLGMQLLMDQSMEYGETEGLGLIPGKVVPIPNISPKGEHLKIPHIGWNSLIPTAADSQWSATLLAGTKPDASFYFVHSYMCKPSEPSDCLAHCDYGGRLVTAVVRRGNVTGCQFHPEKSGPTGLRLLSAFLEQS